jgi:hypothetical protein
VGFPIRKFTDQSLFAAPHDLSQRTTSFIASQRQGIHQIPLRHLIALIAKARVFLPVNRQSTGRALFGIEKTSFASNASGDLSGQAPNPRLVALSDPDDGDRRTDKVRPPPSVVRCPADRMRFLFTMSDIERLLASKRKSLSSTLVGSDHAPRQTKLIKLHRKDMAFAPPRPPSSQRSWWSQTGSNRRPHACKARALPTELWPRRRKAAKRTVISDQQSERLGQPTELV